MGHYVTIAGPDGDFQAYCAEPQVPNGAALVVIQEIFGVNKVMRDLVDEAAAQGYYALSPDLFWRIEPGIDITDQTEAEWQQAFDLFGKFNPDTGIVDIQASLNYARAHGAKVGAVGYCLGGLLAYLTACRTDADACVSYYGVSINDRIDEAKNITKPVMLHIAAEDGYVPPEAQKIIQDGLSSCKTAQVHVYPGLDHAFARHNGAHYDAAGAQLANARTAEFLKGALS